MRWLDGEPLSNYLAKTYNQKSTIDKLISEFLNLVTQLESYGIAHGDLQHGNIIVKNNKLYLIDYDGMYFPDLASLKVNELGHPNFQHPKRTSNDYNKSIDRFSSIVIYTALKALSIAPSLWKKYDNGDNILFRGQDYANPLSSPLFKELAGYSELARLSNNLIAISTWDFNKLPTLKEFISNTYQAPITITPSTISVRSAYTVIDGSQKGRLLEYLGQKVEVVGRISAHRNGLTIYGNPYVFLNFGVYPNQTFTIVIWSEALSELRTNGINPSNLVGKHVSITGVLSSYSGNPQIAIDYASQIQILSGQSEVDSKLSLKTINVSGFNNTTNQKPPISTIQEADVFNDLYRNRPVSQPKINTPSRPTIPSNSTSKTSQSSSNTYKPSTSSSSSSSSSSNSGCTVPIVVGIIGGIIGASIVEHFGGFVIGAIIGAVVGSGIKSIFD